MPRSHLEKAKGRRESGYFIALPVPILQSENFTSLSPKALKLFMALLAQLEVGKGGPRNNGDLCTALAVVRQPGLKSESTIDEAKRELIERGWITLTKQGGMNMGPNLYAFTIWAINDCGGKLDAAPTNIPAGTWRRWEKK